MKKLIYVSVTIILITFLGFSYLQYFVTDSNVSASGFWNKVGEGNLKAVKEEGKWKLYSVGTYYVNMLGIEGKQFNLLSQGVHEIDNENFSNFPPKKIPSQTVNIEMGIGKNQTIIKAGDEVYDVTNNQVVKTKNRDLIVSDNQLENLWLIDRVSGKAKPFLDNTGFVEAKNIVESFGNLGEYNGNLVWGYKPFITEDGENIIFHSNRDSIKNKNFSTSIYVVNKDGKNPKLILDAEKYNQGIRVIGVANNIVVAYLSNNDSIITYNLADSNEKEIKYQGHPVALSPNGSYLLFRKVIDDVVQREFYLLNMVDGTEEKIGMPDNYFYNGVGAWSPDGSKYAFYMNSLLDNDPTKGYRTNVEIGIVDINSKQIISYNKPSETSNLYTLGSISWLDNNQVLAYTDDNTTWSLLIE